MEPSPFAVLWSTPHFVYSPQAVVDTVVGMNPDLSIHQPMVYDHEPVNIYIIYIHSLSLSLSDVWTNNSSCVQGSNKHAFFRQ